MMQNCNNKITDIVESLYGCFFAEYVDAAEFQCNAVLAHVILHSTHKAAVFLLLPLSSCTKKLSVIFYAVCNLHLQNYTVYSEIFNREMQRRVNQASYIGTYT